MVTTPSTFVRTYRIAAIRIFFVLAIPAILFTRSTWSEISWLFETFEWIGLFFIIGAVLGRFWSILYIGGRKQNMVMSDGPYSVCRHPLYFFSTLGAVGFGLMLGSLVLTAFFGSFVFAVLLATARQEEEALRHNFGDQYDRYAARVPTILPKPTLFRTDGYITVDVAHLRGNFFDALVFLALIPIAEAAEAVQEAGWLPTFGLF